MFAPRQRNANTTGALKGHRLKGTPTEQLAQPQQLVTNSLRWHHLSVTFWALMVAEAKRKVDAKGQPNLPPGELRSKTSFVLPVGHELRETVQDVNSF